MGLTLDEGLGQALGILLVLVLVAIGLVACALVVVTPYRVARERGHPNAQAIQVCCIVGLLFWPALVVAWIWAYTVPAGSAAAVPHDPAVITRAAREHVGLGMFRVCGIDPASNMDTQLVVRAVSAQHARAHAEARGVYVTGVDLV
jgi:hypothetical protein